MVWSQPAETPVCHRFSSHRLFPCISFSYPITSLISFSPQQDFLPVLLHNSHFPGRQLGNLPALTATGSALLTAETGAPKVLPMSQAKRVPPWPPVQQMQLRYWQELVPPGTAPAILPAPRQGLQVVILPHHIKRGVGHLKPRLAIYLSRVSRWEEKSQIGSEVSPLEVRSEILGL